MEKCGNIQKEENIFAKEKSSKKRYREQKR
jgi:hypothetical protein